MALVAVVAAGAYGYRAMRDAADGSDTGGSVREPAAYCGVVGLKPTYGRVSRHGLIAFASSLDTPGVLARTVLDSALVLDAIAGPDAMDSTAQPLHAAGAGGFGFAAAAREGGGGGGGGAAGDGQPLAGLVVGVPDEYFVAEMPTAMLELWTRGVEWLVAAGATAVSVSLPHTRHALPTYCLLSSAEASSNLARYDGIRYGASEAFRGGEEGGEGGEGGAAGGNEGLSALAATRSLSFGPEVQRRILTGCFVASAGAVEDYYEKALLVRRSVAADFDAAFAAGVDVLLTPTTPGAPFEIAGCREGDVDPVTMFLNDVMTVPASLAGLPAISVPAALTEGAAATAAGAPAQPRLPLGLQLVGGAMREATLLRAAAALEARAGFELLDGL